MLSIYSYHLGSQNHRLQFTSIFWVSVFTLKIPNFSILNFRCLNSFKNKQVCTVKFSISHSTGVTLKILLKSKILWGSLTPVIESPNNQGWRLVSEQYFSLGEGSENIDECWRIPRPSSPSLSWPIVRNLPSQNYAQQNPRTWLIIPKSWAFCICLSN